MAISTKSFRNGRSTAVRIPAKFGIKPGEELVLSQDEDGTVRVSRAKPFASFFAAVDRMRAGGSDPARDPPSPVPRMGPPRKVDLVSDAHGEYKRAVRRKRTR